MRINVRRIHPSTRPPASAGRRRGRETAHPPARSPEPLSREERARRSGGPQDRALYVCRCGSAFQAAVTASVRCPHCGDVQAW